MTKLPVKGAPHFGVPSLETVTRIDNCDMIAGLQAAHYRLSARMRELEGQFEAEAAKLRQAFLDESAALLQGEAAE